MPLVGALWAALAAPAAPAAAQTWRTLTSARQVRGEAELTVDVTYGAGRFSLSPGSSRTLYRMEMRYDEDRYTPVHEYDADASVVRLGVRGRGGSRVSLGDRRRRSDVASFDLRLSPDVPLTLNLDLGAVQADVELGGLEIRRATYRTGASESRLRFSQPNLASCDLLQLEAGAAEIHVRSLANANCRRVTFHGGVGEVQLDFSGSWRQSMEADVDVGIGSLTLGLPRDVGVSIRLNRFLASFDEAGFVKRGQTYYSENYDRARYRLTLHINATLGGIDVNWLD